jgi:DMATS type aromatic prenyltransferase
MTASNGIAARTFVDFGKERLVALCGAAGVSGEAGGLMRVFELLLEPWGQRRIGKSPAFRSEVADDGAPFEFSIALSSGRPELQVYVDPQADPPAAAPNLQVARASLEVVARELGAPLDRLRELEDLFLPAEPEPPFGLWIGASWADGREVRLKTYLNPHVRGRERGRHLVSEAMRRLGFERAWKDVEELLSLDDGRDEVGIISLDLSRSAADRIKLYVRHHRATSDRIGQVARLTGEHSPSDVAAFYGALAGNAGPFSKKPAATVFAFAESGTGQRCSAALEFPIGAYAETDEAARQRIVDCLSTFGLLPEPYERAIRAFATRPLEARAGIHAHVTLRRVAGAPRMAVYFASEAYAGRTPVG